MLKIVFWILSLIFNIAWIPHFIFVNYDVHSQYVNHSWRNDWCMLIKHKWNRIYFSNSKTLCILYIFFSICINDWPIFSECYISVPPENVRKPSVFWRFQEVQKCNIGRIWGQVEKPCFGHGRKSERCYRNF